MMNDTIINLQTLYHAIISFPTWLWSLSWGWIILITLILLLLLPFIIVGVIHLIFGYSYPNSRKNYTGSSQDSWLLKKFLNDKDSLKELDFTIFAALLIIYLAMHYIPFIPFIKTMIIGFSLMYLLFVTYIFLFYGFMVRLGMISAVIMTAILAYYNVDIGLPNLTPYYKFLGTVINPTDYYINFNQLYYTYVMFIGILWFVAYVVNFFRWRKVEKPEGVINFDEYNVDTGKKKTASELYGVDVETFKNKLQQDLCLLCISVNTQSLIFEKYTSLQISEFLEELRSLENTDNPKQYFLSKLEDLKNEKN
jgi:hypothetical protein